MNINVNDRVRKMEMQRRRRSVMFSRLCANVKRPANLAVTVLILALGWLACTWVKIPLPGGNAHPILVTIWDYAVMLLALVLSMLLTLAVLTMPPLHTKSIESGLQHIGLIDRYGYGPALVSSQGLKRTNIKCLTFYSRGISKERWTKQQPAIEDVLNIHWVDTPQYGGRKGNNRNYIVLVAAPGVESKREEPLYDDEL